MGTYTYGSADEQENIKVLNRAFDLGCTFWDSADIYDNGANEILLSKVLKDRRNEVFLCTKFGIVRGPNGEFSVSGKPEYVHQSCENSLKRLGVDYIDLYYQHRVDPNTRLIPRFQGENFNKNLEIVHKFNEFAEKKGVTPGQLCLSWILAQGDNVIVIPGTRKIKHLEENVEAVKVNLSSEELAEIRQIINSIEIIGNRYNDFFMKSLDL
ncbi:Aldo/keto reductase [Rhizophagus irregularis]|uniref:Aldo/keto reductase n=1 Tax=Rhizophagus irregularis TaxID=588596 RepID=A0A2N0NLL1_9GLOM|nr:Aldo/keto reductase [Rhizophagus irregularis]